MSTPTTAAVDSTTMSGNPDVSNVADAVRSDQISDAAATSSVAQPLDDANKPAGDKPSADTPIGGESTGGKPVGNELAGDKPEEDNTVEEDTVKKDEGTTESTTKDIVDAAPAQTEPVASASEERQDPTLQSERVEQTSTKGKETENAGSPDIKPLNQRQDSVMAIGPAQDEIKAVTPGPGSDGPVCNITLLLTTGTRHPYKLDSKYLTRRNVTVPETTESGHPDPFSISIYTLKELILREWRSDWEAKPASPSSIRLIHFGKLLDDKEPLSKYQFSAENPNVVHMSIRPQDLDEEEPKGGKTTSAAGGEGLRSRGSGCCVIL